MKILIIITKYLNQITFHYPPIIVFTAIAFLGVWEGIVRTK